MKNKFKKLPENFYQRNDATIISKELLGKFLISDIDGVITGGMITEVEAYNGISDKASHAFGGRRTNRTETMYGKGGICYVYLCYGIHHLFNVVTNKINIPHAVLIRAIEPIIGIDEMLKRRRKINIQPTLTSGPGSMSSSLGIKTSDSGSDLCGNRIYIEDRGINISDSKIISTKRVGVDYAGKDALLKYRFYIKENKFISKP